MWDLNHKEGWAPKNWCFWTVVLDKTLESPLDCNEIKPVNPQLSSAQFTHSVVSDSLRPHEPQHSRPPCPLPTPKVHANPCPLSGWCHPAISSSVAPFSSCPQSFPASGSFQMSQLSTSGGQSIGVSASTSVPPMNTQDWSLGLTGLISLQSKGLSSVFSNSIVQKHQFFGAQLSLWSNSHIHITGKTLAVTRWAYISIRVQITFGREQMIWWGKGSKWLCSLPSSGWDF